MKKYLVKTIILNPEDKLKQDYDLNWKQLVSYEDYLAIISQRNNYLNNQSGYERVK